MKCDACGNEVALAKVCPYCGERVRAETKGRTKARNKERPKGTFRGAVRDSGTEGPAPATPSAENPLAAVVRYFLHPGISSARKTLVLAAVFYVLSPLDFFPGAVLPLFGWFDDLAVAAIAWRVIRRELAAVDRKS